LISVLLFAGKTKTKLAFTT